MSAAAPVDRVRRRLGLLAILALLLAAGAVIQGTGWNQTSHYALTKSLAAGTPQIDAYQGWTGDKARHDGHWYSSRAPGLALLSVPAYAALDAVGVPEAAARAEVIRREGEAIWALGLWAALLPLAVILLLVRRLGDRAEPGLGAPAAVALGAGSLLLPFSTMLFSHALSAALGFAAFALLWHEREGPPRLWPLAAAGALVGLGVTTEYPLAFVGIALGALAIARGPVAASATRTARLLERARRGLAYTGGAVAGVLPLLAYNTWAFGSPTHLAYADLKAHEAGFFGIGPPSPAVAVELLFSSRGLLTLAPIVVLAVLGVVLLARRGRRAEALTSGAVALGFVVYNAGYWLPFGGEVPGPRFLITMLPFLGVPLALALRRFPGPAIGLALVSAVTMAVATIVDPLIENEADTGAWAVALAAGRFGATVVSALGIGEGWVAAAPFVLGVGAALALAGAAAARAGLVVSGRQALLGVLAAAGWAALAVLAPPLLGIDASAGARIVAAGGSARPAVAHGALPLLELALLALGVALAGLAVAYGLLRGPRPGGTTVDAAAGRLPASRAASGVAASGSGPEEREPERVAP